MAEENTSNYFHEKTHLDFSNLKQLQQNFSSLNTSEKRKETGESEQKPSAPVEDGRLPVHTHHKPAYPSRPLSQAIYSIPDELGKSTGTTEGNNNSFSVTDFNVEQSVILQETSEELALDYGAKETILEDFSFHKKAMHFYQRQRLLKDVLKTNIFNETTKVMETQITKESLREWNLDITDLIRANINALDLFTFLDFHSFQDYYDVGFQPEHFKERALYPIWLMRTLYDINYKTLEDYYPKLKHIDLFQKYGFFPHELHQLGYNIGLLLSHGFKRGHFLTIPNISFSQWRTLFYLEKKHIGPLGLKTLDPTVFGKDSLYFLQFINDSSVVEIVHENLQRLKLKGIRNHQRATYYDPDRDGSRNRIRESFCQSEE